MKIYFTSSSLYKEQYQSMSQRIVKFLEEKGHDVFGNTLSENLLNPEDTPAHAIAEWDKKWHSYIRDCDLAIVEGSYPSTIDIGYETGVIYSIGKPIILLFKEGKEPIHMNNLYAGRFIKSVYTAETLEDTLKWCLSEAEKISNRRFTFFISPQIELFLNKIVKEMHVTRSEYIRKLIEDEIRKQS